MYQRILVPVDGSAPSNRGLDEAIRLARLTGGRLRLLHVIDLLSLELSGHAKVDSSGEVSAPRLVREQAEVLLRDGESAARAQGVVADSALLYNTAGRISTLVADEALRWQAELIVIGTHGRRGIARAMLGSDAEQIVRTVPVPVLLVRATGERQARTSGGSSTPSTCPAARA